ncbi:MFS transporter [Methanothermobacter tenebrarum]|jgi:EmrB/QacA subfamily drug resistance transporter|uniref:MFS transporter n=1 Tax=Methanothermobacter tenebrarum TaxID=680118 RepID=A0ABN6PAR9_9EURY|nr:MFS transporter [Methanothermobacter tenebrarum]MDI6881700.1 MFS transporter [Methanothermobacter sp.]MDX9693088.1 MFS transporter [Methanothermobacter sp.]BDH79327.1 MFS transporter [Methanothermobacter tenebrarum]HOQ20497.1 MFS transporter [Methanothermobacter sp.]
MVEISSRRYFILATIMLASIMGPIDASIVNTILPTIAQYFKVEVALVQWVPMIYLLTISSLLLFYGRLGDIFGYKKVYVMGLAGFIISSLLCGISPNIYFLIAFRALQGIFAAMMMAVPFAIITASFPPMERGKALGINAISISAGLALGPSIGGFITALLNWRFTFFINIPIGVLGLLLAWRIIPEFKGQKARVDIPGAITVFISLFLFLLFVNRAQLHGLDYQNMIILLVSTILGIIFFMLEVGNEEPLLNLNLFKNMTFSFANLSALLNFMSQYVMVFVTPFYLQRVMECPPDKVGLLMTAFPLATLIVAPISGWLSDKIGTRILACVGAAICALSLSLMAQLPISATHFDVAWRLALFGIGTGIFQSPNNSAVMGSVPKPFLGTASGILATMRNVGMVLGIATAGLILYNTIPSVILQKTTLGASDIHVFFSGLKHAYIGGAFLTGIASITSLIRR